LKNRGFLLREKDAAAAGGKIIASPQEIADKIGAVKKILVDRKRSDDR
jgi:hypothetical protein